MGVCCLIGRENGKSLDNPAEHLPWLLSRSLGLAAMFFLSLSVAWGLAFSSRMAKLGPGSLGRARQVHEGLSLVAIVLILGHAFVLLWDNYIAPSFLEIVIPFQMDIWVSIGIVAAWITLISGLAHYLRKRIGPAWKILHRFVLLGWILALVHVLGSGSEVASNVFPFYLGLLLVPVVFALVYRLLPEK